MTAFTRGEGWNISLGQNISDPKFWSKIFSQKFLVWNSRDIWILISFVKEFRIFLIIVFIILGVMTVVSFVLSCWLINRKRFFHWLKLKAGNKKTDKTLLHLRCYRYFYKLRFQTARIGKNVCGKGLLDRIFGIQRLPRRRRRWNHIRSKTRKCLKNCIFYVKWLTRRGDLFLHCQ